MNRRRIREKYLNNLKLIWIDGFLYQSLHTEVIKLTMTAANETVLAKEANRRSWKMFKRQVGQANEVIPLDKPIGAIFQESGCGLLILGDPGSGKTITLLQLAEELITEAKLPGQPMPIVLNLSSWAQEKQAFVDWMVEEIFIQYRVSRDLARHLITSNNFTYLLDGLDEVAADARDDCVIAINEFKATQPNTIEMVVCSRIADYEALSQHLNLNTAIQIQPLNETQVNSVLQQSGLEMQAVRAMLKTDPPLRELAQSPLLLNIMMLAYQGKTITDLQQLKTVGARRQHLFNTYTDAMFARRPLPPNYPYTKSDACHWLTEIAYGLRQHQVSEFYIERLQSSWFPIGKPSRHYSIIVRLFGGLLFGLLGGLLFGLFGGLPFGLFGGLLLGLFGGLLVNINKIKPVKKLQRASPLVLVKKIVGGLLFGLLGGLLLGLFGGLLFGLFGGLLFGLLGWLLFGLLGWLLFGLLRGLLVNINKIKPAKKLQRASLLVLVKKIVGVLLFGLLSGLGVGLIVKQSFGLIAGLGIGLIVGLSFGLLFYGGDAVIQHYTMRWLLSRQNILPYSFSDKKIIAYLDAMMERNFLRRTGKSYIFIHHSLMEHFAAMHSSQVDD